jgi:dTDP-D-glucose 4,6-dehydratase
MRVLVTGGAGFIGSSVVRQYIAETEATVIKVDALTCAGNPESSAYAREPPRHGEIRVGLRIQKAATIESATAHIASAC